MVLVKEKPDEKIINLNPTFILWDYEKYFSYGNFTIYVITLLEISLIIFLLYYFFTQELIFIYNYFIGPQKTLDDEIQYNNLDNMLQQIVNSTLKCYGDNLYYEYNNESKQALALNGEAITDCVNILNKYQN